MNETDLNCDVAIVGGGPAGLAVATELRRQGIGRVVVFERETDAGGIPRHCGHYPFGFWEFKRLMKGPDYARTLVYKAKQAGVHIRTGTTVTQLNPNACLELSSAEGQTALRAKRVVLCTGVRESSRAQRFLGGARPQGVISTGALQSMVYLHHQRPFRRPVILGTELVSFSTIMTCRHMGIKPVAMIEQNDRVTVRQIMRPYPTLKGIPIRFGAKNLRILGNRTVEAVEYQDPNGGTQTIQTDGVIVTGQFRPESALLRASHLALDPGTGGPSIDQFGRASDPSYFCTGNLLRPVETSAWCWHEGVATASRVAQDLRAPIGDCKSIPIGISSPSIRFAVPQRLSQTDAPGAMEMMQIRLTQPSSGYLCLSSAGNEIWGDYFQSRPERRLLAPLPFRSPAQMNGPIDLEILGGYPTAPD